MKRSGIQMNWCGVQHAKGRGGGWPTSKRLILFTPFLTRLIL